MLLLIPLAFTLLYAGATAFPPHKDIRYLWANLAANVVLWAVNAHACAGTLWLFVLHDVYHVLIAQAFVFAACLGVCLDAEHWEFRGLRRGWPEIAAREDPAPPPVVKARLRR